MVPMMILSFSAERKKKKSATWQKISCRSILVSTGPNQHCKMVSMYQDLMVLICSDPFLVQFQVQELFSL